MVTSSVIESQIKIIEQLIRNNPNFVGNEDLFEEFMNEAYSKLHVFINSIKDLTKIEGYAAKVVNTSILTILKNKGRIKLNNVRYSKTKPLQIDVSNINDIIKSPSLKYEDKIKYELIDPRFSYNKKNLSKEIIKHILNSVIQINQEYPDKQYLKLYKLRYINKKTQNQISFELNIPQMEVSKRIFELSNMIKLNLK